MGLCIDFDGVFQFHLRNSRYLFILKFRLFFFFLEICSLLFSAHLKYFALVFLARFYIFVV